MTFLDLRKSAVLVSLMLAGFPVSAQWHSFRWIERVQEGMSTKNAALLIPVALDGTPCEMQLDTGAGVSVLYRHALPSRYRVEGDSLIIDRVIIGPQMSSNRMFRLMYPDSGTREPLCKTGDDQGIVGTLGNDVFRH